jgi:hypothetical protein
VTAVAVASVLAFGVGACSSDSGADVAAEQVAVKTSYRAFAEAVAAKNGPAAARLLSTSTLAYYDDLRDSALDDDRAELSQRSVLDQLTVLSMRHNIAAATLRTGNPLDVVSAGVAGGAISAGDSPQEGLDQISITGDRATAVLALAGDKPKRNPIEFAKEGGVWKFDLTSVLPAAQAELKLVQQSTGYTTEKLVQDVQVSRYGKAESAKLWQPIGRS